MKITCQACAAKYTIADDKVLGKIVKIRCKKCGATIVVNGNDPSAVAGAAAEPPRAFDYAAQSAGVEQWTVNVADGDQRTMSDPELVAAYQAGIVNDETFCWKDGMTDWLPLREIEQLYSACTATRVAPAGAIAGMAAGMVPDEGATRIQDTGAALFGGGSSPAPAYAAPLPAAGSGNGVGEAMSPAAPIAARRAGGRAPGADLFAGAAQAGGEDDVMTSAPAGMPQVHGDAPALTGARNENSVLFSLNALTSKPGPGGGAPMPATSEASGLIDIRQLSAQVGIGEEKKRSRIDDIMNLAGGGAFSPSLSGPVLSAPPIEEYAAPPPDMAMPGTMAPPAKSKALIFLAIGIGAFVIVGAIGAAVMFTHKGDEASTDKAAANASAASATASPTPSASVAMTEPPPAASAPEPASATAAPPPAATETTQPAAAPEPPKPAPAHQAAAAPRETPHESHRESAPAPAPASDQPFNMGEAKAKLGAVAESLQSCKRGDVTGTGRVIITFSPSGRVQSAVISGPPFEGTPTGSCVAARFRAVRVPAFGGSPFSVSKHFTVN